MPGFMSLPASVFEKCEDKQTDRHINTADNPTHATTIGEGKKHSFESTPKIL